jgi:hypothetical protein
MNKYIDAIRSEIHRRALLLVVDNPRHGANLHLLETAMLIGASVVMETPLDTDTEDQLALTPAGDELLRQLFEGEPKAS